MLEAKWVVDEGVFDGEDRVGSRSQDASALEVVVPVVVRVVDLAVVVRVAGGGSSRGQRSGGDPVSSPAHCTAGTNHSDDSGSVTPHRHAPVSGNLCVASYTLSLIHI